VVVAAVVTVIDFLSVAARPGFAGSRIFLESSGAWNPSFLHENPPETLVEARGFVCELR
jgi:hypothetical protein